tara:strand:+ start:90 stop:1088 length:999 start_codon:yes stop_codon:yes gene_type:complete
MNAQLDCGYIYLNKMTDLLSKGFYPDVIVSHTGWGCGLFAKYVYPNARLIAYCELWFNAYYGEYRGIEEKYKLDKKQSLSMYKRNTTQANELACCDEIICATEWQKSLLPRKLAEVSHVIHEGTDCDFFIKNDKWKMESRRLITYATRGMEPMRGFPEFIDGAVKFISKNGNKYMAEIAGQDKVYYGKPAETSYKKLAESNIESHGLTSDIVFRGRLNRKDYARLLKRSSIHCYFTREFVPSWSLIDAMSSGCLLLVNKTASVRELLPEKSVIWIENLNKESVYKGLVKAKDILENDPEKANSMRDECRQNAIRKYNRKTSIRKWFNIIEKD